MAEVLTILGVIASCDQLIKRFTDIESALWKAYKVIRYAKEDVKKVKDRTVIILDLWYTFLELMEEVYEIDGVSIDLKGYGRLNLDLNKQAENIIRKISSILDTLHPLWTHEPVAVWREFYTIFKWFIRKQEDIRLLYVDMELLTGYMHVFIDLVQLQIAIQQYKINESAATKVQVDTIARMIEIELREIQQTLRSIVINGHTVKNENLVDEMRNVLQHEFSQLPSGDTRNDSTSDSRRESPPPPASPSAVPTSPLPGPGGPDTGYRSAQVPSPEPGLEPQSELNGSLGLPENSPSSVQQPILFFPQSEASYVSGQESVPPIHPDISAASSSPPVEEENKKKLRGDGMYIATALFGPPEMRHRPAPTQISTDSFTNYPPPKDSSSSKGARQHGRQHSTRTTAPGPSGIPRNRPERKVASHHTRQEASKHSMSKNYHADGSQYNDSSETKSKNNLPRRAYDRARSNNEWDQGTYGVGGAVLPGHIVALKGVAKVWHDSQ